LEANSAMDVFGPLFFLVAWVVLQAWLLPKLGVPT
jgi:flagellar biogenesis protein FliO